MQYSPSPPLAEKEWRTADEAPSGGPAPDQAGRSDPRFGRRPTNAPVHPLRQVSERPSIGRRMFRSVGRFAVAVLIGVGATLGWQSYGDAAREMLVARAPALASLLPASVVKSPSVAAAAPDPMQQLGPMASSLDAVRRSVEQLSTRQEQMAQNIAALQAVGEDLRQKVSSPPPAAVQPATPVPQHRPAQARAPSPAAQPSPAPRSPPPAGAAAPSR